MKFIAADTYSMGARALFCFVLAGLSACSALQPSARPLVYDFGPGLSVLAPANKMAQLPALVLAEVDASSALDGTAVLYRLAYSDAQQVRPYAQARWSMPPAQLLQQRLRSQLGQRRTVLGTADAAMAGRQTLTLRTELEEFSQVFEAPDQSKGLVRVRATLVQGRGDGGAAGGDRMSAQRTFVVQRPAQGADAAHGVRALTEATDALLEELDTWVQQVQLAHPAGVSTH